MSERTFPEQAIRLIAVDLTPVLPGGDNGGAKVFALELVRMLSAIAPGTRFVLLTQAATHEELAALDAPNVERVQVLGPAASAGRRGLFEAVTRLIARWPAWAKRRVARAGYAAHRLLKRGARGGPVSILGADLLFCPFTAPTFHRAGVPTVCTVYDLQFEAYPQFFSPEDAEQRERALIEAGARASALAAISDFTRTAVSRRLPRARPPVATIYMRLSGRAGANGDSTILDTLRVRRSGYFLYPANYWRHKNHEMLLTAFGMARQRGLDPALRLVLTGAPGARERWLRDAAAAMGLGEHVVFAGFVSDAALRALLGGCAALVFPSLYEGFGLPVVDAMALGVPVVCSNAAALPEAAGGSALLIDPRDPDALAAAMVRAHGEPALRAKLGEAGRRRAAEFCDAERMAREYLELFAAAVAGRA